LVQRVLDTKADVGAFFIASNRSFPHLDGWVLPYLRRCTTTAVWNGTAIPKRQCTLCPELQETMRS
ncbi:unnamed protein product, partial [Ixodes pacificus]